MPTKEIDLVKYVEVETKAMSYEKVTEDTEVAIKLGLGLDLDNSSDDVTVQAVITDENREQILDGIKQYLTSFANENPDLQENISQYLIDMNDYSNQELEKLILEFAEGQKVVKEMELHEAESVLAPYMSCGQEANQESIELEGIYDEVQSHEVLA